MSTTTVSGSDATAESQYEAALAAVRSPAFRDATARDKQEMLWTFISRVPYPVLPSLRTSNFGGMRRLASRKRLRIAFTLDDDVRPPRTKVFHPFGTIAKVRFTAERGHPFTGIFASGAVGFMRASLASGMPKYSPAAAFKFMIDGPRPSENLLLLPAFDMQSSRDFFERAPTNRTVPAAVFPNTIVVPLLQRWTTSVSHPTEMQRLDHLAEVASDGSRAGEAVAPELVFLYASDEVRGDPASDEDFRSILARIPPGTLLYRVYARTAQSEAQILVGSITTESSFVASEFGDRILALKHAWGSPDPPAS